MTKDKPKQEVIPLEVIAKIDKEYERPTFFFPDTSMRWENINGSPQLLIGCWTKVEGHSDAVLDYFKNDCRPPKTEEEKQQIEDDLQFYKKHYDTPPNKIKIVRQITAKHYKNASQ
jgi:hypothetical protein